MKKERTEWNFNALLYEYMQLKELFDGRSLETNDWPKSTRIKVQRLLSAIKAYSGISYDLWTKDGKQEFILDFRCGLQMKNEECSKEQTLRIKDLLATKNDLFLKISDSKPTVSSYYEPLFRLYEVAYDYITAFNDLPKGWYDTPFEIVDKFKCLAIDSFIQLKTKAVIEAMKVLMGKPFERTFTVEELQTQYGYPKETDDQLRQYDIDFFERESAVEKYKSSAALDFQKDFNEPMLTFTSEFFDNYPDVISQIADALNVDESSFGKLTNCKDIWARDFMPVQRQDNMYVQYRYSPDYLQNSKDIPYQTNPEEVELLGMRICDQIVGIKTNLVIDGGNVINCLDIHNKPCVIITEKVLVENKDKSYCEIITELSDLFSAEVIIIPWDREEPYGHADGMVRYLSPGKVLINNFKEVDKKIHTELTRALMPHFQIEELEYGRLNRKDSWCHLNYIETDMTSLFLLATSLLNL